eukprot:120767_1
MAKTILVAGGAGYIGTHTSIELLNSGFNVIVVDNFSNSSPIALERVEKLTGKSVELHDIDLALNPSAVNELFRSREIDAVIHFAGLKAVGESSQKPLEYYSNNINSTTNLLTAMEENGCRNMIFSSSATVYGEPERIPLDENCRVGPGITNPYGKTKYFIEEILTDFAKSREDWKVVLLRYFNPVGAHESGLIGEDPQGIPNNLLPYISQVAVGRRPHLNVFGDDYDTTDGTGVRDYIHVTDLARGHMAALEKVILVDSPPNPRISAPQNGGVWVYNLGRGAGVSVLEMVRAMEKACGHEIKYRIQGRRPGDVATCYADSSKAAIELEWTCKFDIERVCTDAWRWQSRNPQGFESKIDTEGE